MKAGDVRICPTCGTRNKPKWEFCVSCGEPLQDVSVTQPMLPPVASAAPTVVVEALPRAGPSPFGLLVGLALAAGAGYLTWTWTRDGSEPANASAFFVPSSSVPTPPATQPRKA